MVFFVIHEVIHFGTDSLATCIFFSVTGDFVRSIVSEQTIGTRYNLHAY